MLFAVLFFCEPVLSDLLMSLIILHKFCGFSSVFIYFFTVLSCFEVLFTSNVALTFF